MKRFTILLLSAMMIFTVACQKDDEDNDDDNNTNEENQLSPQQVQNGFAINYTATWCGPCGSWGAPRINNMGNAAPNGVIITAHASNDPMHNATLYGDLNAERSSGGGIPSFWVGDVSSATESDMDALLQQTPDAGIDISYSIEGTTMTIETKTKFFNAVSGNFHLSCFVLEDGIDGSSSAGQYAQNGTSSSYPNDDYEHNFVLRAATSTGTYGNVIATDPAADAEFDETLTATIENSWVNPYPGCVIWQKSTGSTPQFMYVNSIKKKN